MGVMKSTVVQCGLLLALQQQAFAQLVCQSAELLAADTTTFGPPFGTGLCLDTCTSDRIADSTLENIVEVSNNCATGATTVTFTADLRIDANADSSYDVGLYFVGGDGNCDAFAIGCTDGAGGPDIPFHVEFNGPNDLNDVCADVNQGISIFPRLEFEAPCPSAGEDLSIPYCFSWDTNRGNACSDGDDVAPKPNPQCECNSAGFTVLEECLTTYSVETKCVADASGDFTTTQVTLTGGVPGETISYALVADGNPAPAVGSSDYVDYTGPFDVDGLAAGTTILVAVEGCGIVDPVITTACTPCVDNLGCPPGQVCCEDKLVCEVGTDSTACGDPHMTGFMGQKFDFTGEDGGWYALIADENMHVNMRVSCPVADLPEITYITGLSVLTTDENGFDHSIVIEVKDPHNLDSSCPAGVSPCLADGSLRVVVDGEETLLAPGTVFLGEGVEVSAANLPGACRSFGFEKYWDLKKLEYAAHARRLGDRLTMAEWILGDPTATNMAECEEYLARAEAGAGGVFAHQSEHASFRIVTPNATVRLSHGKLHQIAMRDPTDQYDLPDHLTWQMNMAVDHNEVSGDARGILGETFVPTRDVDGEFIMTGMEAIRGTQEDYRVEEALGTHFFF